MDCDFKEMEDGSFVCTNCKFKIDLPHVKLPIHKHCSFKGSVKPTAADMAKSAAKAAKDFIRNKEKFVSKEETEKRREICQGCEFFDKKWARCTACGCFVGLKTKLKGQSCPEDKW